MTAHCDLLSVAVAINKASSLEEILCISISKLEELVPFDRATIAFRPSDNNHLELRDLGEGCKSLDSSSPPEYPRCHLPSCMRSVPLSRDHLLGRVVLEAEEKEGQQAQTLAQLPDECMDLEPLEEDTQSCMAVSLGMRAGRVFGALMVESFQPDAYEQQDLEAFREYASLIAVAMENLKNFQKARQSSLEDGLTGIYNHRYLAEILPQELKRIERYGGQLSVVLMDLDSFKELNDQYGHLAGDQMLQQTAHLVDRELRATDNVFRYGGDEFVILLPGTEVARARNVIQRLQEALRQNALVLRSPEGETQSIPEKLTASFGIAMAPQHGLHPEVLIQRADQALYRAKEKGRDQACLAVAP